jgi:DNA helicase HerA-like ATPase
MIVVDEVMQVCPSAITIPAWYKGALTRGMELGVGVWSLTQRPSTIPISILSESTHYFIFRLNAISDRKRLVDYTGQTEFLEMNEKRVFWYYNTVDGKPPQRGQIILDKK